MSDETTTTPEPDDVDGHKFKTPVYIKDDADDVEGHKPGIKGSLTPADEDDVAGHKFKTPIFTKDESVETNINWRQGHGGAPD